VRACAQAWYSFQWQRLLNVWGGWCFAHKAHLVALAGLAVLPIVNELNVVYAQMQNVSFVRAMCAIRRNNKTDYGGIALTRVQKVFFLHFLQFIVAHSLI
jgi:hypothetical protein